MGIEIEDMRADGRVELLGRGDGYDAGGGGEKFWIEDVQGGGGHAIVDRFTMLLENFHKEGFKTGALPCGSEELDDCARRRDDPRGDEFSRTNGEEGRVTGVVPTSSSQVHRNRVDEHEEGLGCGQGADGSST